MDTRERILVVDDEPSFTDDLCSALRAKHELAVASTVAQAQEMVWAERPDMVILGTLAPRGEAFRLHQWLKQTPAVHRSAHHGHRCTAGEAVAPGLDQGRRNAT